MGGQDSSYVRPGPMLCQCWRDVHAELSITNALAANVISNGAGVRRQFDLQWFDNVDNRCHGAQYLKCADLRFSLRARYKFS